MSRIGVLLITIAMIAMIAPAASVAVAQTKEDLAGIESAVLDYVEGVYEMTPERIERSVHPDLTKFGFSRRSPDDDWRMHPMTFDQLVNLAATYYKKDGGPPAGSPKKIEILDALNKTASAKLTAAWGVDYFHLVKYDDKWMIVQIVWQSLD